jgi:RNA polymerase sigma-70 factor (ECF subfamily)
MQLYVDRFNRRDWDGLRELISADASLRVADAFAGRLTDSPYFGNYDRWSIPWKLALGEVDSERAVIILQRGVDTCSPFGIVRLIVSGAQINRIADYSHSPWVISTATSVALSAAAPSS